jgi:heme-degrading monooxygenase HmoA
MHARVAKYTYTGDPHEISQRAEEGLLPIFQSTPGFHDYTIITNDEKVISISTWDSAESADAANAAAAEWVTQNMADDIELKNTTIGEIIVSTTHGITTKAGITA